MESTIDISMFWCFSLKSEGVIVYCPIAAAMAARMELLPTLFCPTRIRALSKTINFQTSNLFGTKKKENK